MIIDVAYMRSCGFALERETRDATILLAISEAELYTIKSAVGDAAYIRMQTMTGAIMDGGVVAVRGGSRYVAGIKKAAAYIAYSSLLQHTLVSTSYGTTKKKDDNSVNASEGDIVAEGKRYFEIGVQYLRECCEIEGIEFNLNSNTYIEFL